MYFSSRMQAGRMLAAKMLPKYRYENCAIVALDDGGVVVGAQIAMQLHCILTFLQTKEITLPREPNAIAGITGGGNFVFNKDYSEGEVDEMVGEFRSYLEEERFTKTHEVNQAIGKGELINLKSLKHMNVILVSDGLSNPMKLDLAEEYLKPIEIDSLIVAIPVASVPVIDRVHVMADAVYCLSVIDDYFDTDHYYEKKDIPDHAKITKTIKSIVLNWK